MMTIGKPMGKTRTKPEHIPERAVPSAAGESAADHLTEAIELLFFAYRDFISDPDEILIEYGFGRAHHRVVHFVGRHPGITVAELLDILRITKQSLARVLKQLIERGFIEQETGKQDRRQRMLFLTTTGRELEQRLAAPQRARVAGALEKAGPGADSAWRAVLLALVNEEHRPEVESLIAKTPAG
jgi:DNA-binding MarR family transcriptional regulator